MVLKIKFWVHFCVAYSVYISCTDGDYLFPWMIQKLWWYAGTGKGFERFCKAKGSVGVAPDASVWVGSSYSAMKKMVVSNY